MESFWNVESEQNQICGWCPTSPTKFQETCKNVYSRYLGIRGNSTFLVIFSCLTYILYQYCIRHYQSMPVKSYPGHIWWWLLQSAIIYSRLVMQKQECLGKDDEQFWAGNRLGRGLLGHRVWSRAVFQSVDNTEISGPMAWLESGRCLSSSIVSLLKQSKGRNRTGLELKRSLLVSPTSMDFLAPYTQVFLGTILHG